MSASRIVAGCPAALLAVAVIAAPAQAQFGGILRSLPSASSASKTTDGCAEGKSRSAGSRVLGNILGQAASGAAGRAGGLLTYVPVAEFTDQITAAIACKLDPEEQKQAAEATLEATRGTDEDGLVEVGSTSEWTSNTRENVSGRSTVVARGGGQGRGPEGADCITVSDVIIVSGEETRAEKRMCRAPGAARYSIVV